jgi:hypothetical protein
MPFDVEAARKSGYTDDEIIGHLTQTRKFDVPGALQAGYSNADIIRHLSGLGSAQESPTATKAPASQGFLGNWWNEVKSGPANLPAMGNALLSPIELAKGWTAQGNEIARRTSEAWRSGSYVPAAAHALNYGINAIAPGVGYGLDEAGNKFMAGDIEGGLGQTAGVATNLGAGALLPKAARGTAKAIYNIPEIPNAFRPNASVPIIRAFSLADPQLLSKIPGTEMTPIDAALSDIQAASKRTGIAPTSNEGFWPNAKAAMQRNRNAWDVWMNRAKGRITSGDAIVQSTAENIADSVPTARRVRILQDAQNRYGGELTAQKLEQMLHEKNGELSPFYSKDEGARAAAHEAGAQNGRSMAVLEGQRNVIARSLYNLLDPEGAGAGPAELQLRYKALRDMYGESWGSRTKIAAEKPVSAASGIGQIGVGLLDLPGKFLHGEIEKGLSAIRHPMSGTTDPLIATAINAAAEQRPHPLPQSALYPAGMPGRALPAPSPRLNLPGGGGIVAGTGLPPGQQMNIWEGQGAPLQLPEGKAPFTQGIVVPDILGRPSAEFQQRLSAGTPGSPTGITIMPMPGDAYLQDVGRVGYPEYQMGPAAPPQPIPPPVDWRAARPSGMPEIEIEPVKPTTKTKPKPKSRK